MKAKFMNEVHLEGLLYEHNLALKVSGSNSKNPGTEFISGTLKIATDADLLNTVEVHYTYVTEKTKNGGTNSTFTNLKSIIDGSAMTYMAFKGKENYQPSYVRVDTAIGLNDFFTERDGKEELVSAKRNEGGFLHFIKEAELKPEDQRNTFEADMVITSIARLEPNEESETPARMRVKGVVFDFRRGILPVEFMMYNPQGMDLFEDQNPSANSPFCTKVSGTQISQTYVIRREEESAFGPALVKEYPRSRKEYVIESIFNQISYPWDDAGFITADELRKAMGDRETYLATVKKNNEEYKAQRSQGSVASTAPQATVQSKSGGFNF